MSNLDQTRIVQLRNSIDHCQSPWILAAFCKAESQTLANAMQGTIGYLDWRLHGQLSHLLKSQKLQSGNLAMVYGANKLGKASLLVYYFNENENNLLDLISSLKKLKANQIGLAESTFSDERKRMTIKALTKANITWKSLERINH